MRPWRGTDVEPMIEILTNCLSGRKAVATKVPLREHAVEVGSCGPQPSTNEFADELATPGIPVATNLDADQPFAWPTANDLTNLAAHLRHTTPLLRVGFIGGSVKGKLTGIQPADYPNPAVASD